MLPLKAIVLPDYQPRLSFDDSKLEQMAKNIKVQGILNRLIVRRRVGTDQYELVAGGRRYRAAQVAGLKEIPVVIKKLTDEEALALAITENLQREELKPLEETESIMRLIALRLGQSQKQVQQLLTRMYNDSKRKSDSEQNVLFTSEAQVVQAVFEELSCLSWESFVTSRLPLLNLPTEILAALREGKIAYTKAQAISQVKDPESRAALLAEVLAQNLSLTKIKAKIKNINSEASELSPQETIQAVTQKVTKSKVWQNPQKWKQVQNLLKKLESLLEED